MTNFILTPDIEETILVALGLVFKQELITKTAPGDILSLKTLKVAPLQDDPTLVAPYLVYAPDPDKGYRLMSHEEEHIYGCAEIGGPIRFLRFYKALCGTPIVGTRESALGAINNLTTRIVGTLMQYFDLAGVVAVGPLMSADNSHLIEGANQRLVDGVTTKLEGGEQTWFTKGTVCWHYPVSWYQPARVFTGSVLGS